MDLITFTEPNFIVIKDIEIEIELDNYPVIFEAGDFISLYKDNKSLIIGDGGSKRFILGEEMATKLLDCCSPILNNYEELTESVDDCNLNYKLASLKGITEPKNLLECKQCKSIKVIEN